MSLDQARAAGAMGVFGSKYGGRVTVYTIGDFPKRFVAVRTSITPVNSVFQDCQGRKFVIRRTPY